MSKDAGKTGKDESAESGQAEAVDPATGNPAAAESDPVVLSEKPASQVEGEKAGAEADAADPRLNDGESADSETGDG